MIVHLVNPESVVDLPCLLLLLDLGKLCRSKCSKSSLVVTERDDEGVGEMALVLNTFLNTNVTIAMIAYVLVGLMAWAQWRRWP